MKTQTLNLENHEVIILILTLNGMLSTLEKDYKEGENTEGYFFEDALTEINDLKALIKKVNSLKTA